MLDRNLILCSLPAGLALGVAVWAAGGRGGVQADALQAAANKLQTMRPAIRRGVDAAALPTPLASPLFVQPEAGAMPAEISVVLQGLTRNARRQAALLAIAGQPADWLGLGETRDGVTLDSVRASGVTISTANGPRELGFGPVTTPPPSAQLADPSPPPGMRSPPPPASAPGAP